jgi:hypothetical protein
MLEMRRDSLNLSEGQFFFFFFFFFFFHWLYIPGWDLTSSMRFRNSNDFYKVGSSASRPNTQPGGPEYPF